MSILRSLEHVAQTVRHSGPLGRAERFWGVLRPVYNGALGLFGRRGLVRTINGTDTIRVASASRGVTDEYEPDVWPQVMAALRPGDTFVDVGAYIGLYAIAAMPHVGPTGRVVAFEPDRANRADFEANLALNRHGSAVEVVPKAAGEHEGFVVMGGASSEAQTSYAASDTGIACTTLDAEFPDTPVHVLKVDVEGFEEEVLRGARALLRDPARRPRVLFVEMHPFAWGRNGTTSESILAELAASGYEARHVDGRLAERVDTWEEIVATAGPL